MMKKQCAAILISSASAIIFFMCVAAVIFISNNSDASAFSETYWTNGHFYQFFFEPMFYQYISNGGLSGAKLELFIHSTSLMWALFSLTIILLLKKMEKLDSQTLCIASLILLFGPSLWGMLSFKANDIPLRQSGPIIAFALMSILYLIVPLTVLLVKQLYKNDVYV